MFDYGKRLMTLRKAQKKTQKEVADAIGSTIRGYQNYEYNHSEMNHDKLLRLLDFYGISADFFFMRKKETESGQVKLMKKITSAHLDDLERELRNLREATVKISNEISAMKKDVGVKEGPQKELPASSDSE